MAKVHCHPQIARPPSAPTTWNPVTTCREVYTLWTKSLVLSGNGCTVYDSAGSVAYRVDNYGCRGGDEVYLMDRSGNAVYKILRRKLVLNGGWEGYRMRCEAPERRPWFRVQKDGGVFWKGGKSSELRITVGCGAGAGGRAGREGEEAACYRVQGLKNNKPAGYKIMDLAGKPVAEVQRKQAACGVVLGEDVLTLVVEDKMDRLLVMGLVVVCGLFKNTM